MNKLILVGNGFDLAHGLPTSYKHFIDDFWKNFQSKKNHPLYKDLFELNDLYCNYFGFRGSAVNNFSDFIQGLSDYCDTDGHQFNQLKMIATTTSNEKIFNFKNLFLKLISEQSIANWVDIEHLYFSILKSIDDKTKYTEYDKGIHHLNKEFLEIKNLFESYLKENILDRYDFSKAPTNYKDILDLFRIRGRELDPDSATFIEFPIEDKEDLIEFYKKLVANQTDLHHENLFLDFNYTPTIDFYVKQINSMGGNQYGKALSLKIHGEVGSSKNPINFGFGDEMDEAYKSIENKNDNRYLENIKSFQYLHNSNYRKLLNWIGANKFQVYIFGHSCGLSDRTLLKTIFEHDHCRSIKIFYHQEGTKDNFTDLTNNISRHFDDKKMMRAKIVDKTNCMALPQAVRFRNK